MPFTRDERAIIENIINKIDKLSRALDITNTTLATLSDYLDVIGAKTTIGDMSTEELKAAISNAVRAIVKSMGPVKHTHESSTQGGPCFAEKGAALISDTNIENEEPETP